MSESKYFLKSSLDPSGCLDNQSLVATFLQDLKWQTQKQAHVNKMHCDVYALVECHSFVFLTFDIKGAMFMS